MEAIKKRVACPCAESRLSVHDSGARLEGREALRGCDAEMQNSCKLSDKLFFFFFFFNSKKMFRKVILAHSKQLDGVVAKRRDPPGYQPPFSYASQT